MFVGCAVPAVLAIAYVLRWVEADRGQAPLPLLAQVAQYARKQTYRLAGYASFGGVSMHFVVIGFSTVYFVDRGVDLRLVAVLLAAGAGCVGPGEDCRRSPVRPAGRTVDGPANDGEHLGVGPAAAAAAS